MKISATRYHDISCGHRVVGHEGKCVNLHGHNYRVHFTVETEELDEVGRALDFSVIKSRLCNWLEQILDHRMLIWAEDPMMDDLCAIDPGGIVVVPFNPTAENIAKYLLSEIGPEVLRGTPATLTKVVIEETRKCSAEAHL